MKLLFYDFMKLLFSCYYCILSYPFIFLVINVFLLNRYLVKLEVRGLLYVNGLIYGVVYIIFIQIPYYFMGYKEITSRLPGEALGITANTFIGDVSYLLSFPTIGYSFLITGLTAMILGRINYNIKAYTALQVIVIIYYLLSLYSVSEYEIINDVLE